jgi:hypothetical protein
MKDVRVRKLLKLKNNSSGDTIIEVMLAMALLTAFLFISWGITNKATQIGINSRKRVEMVNSMKEQAEIIKAFYAKNGSKTAELINNVNPTTTGLDKGPCEPDGVTTDNVFHFTTDSGDIVKQKQKKNAPDADNTLWVQYKQDTASDPKFSDFYIRSCWQTVGSTQNTDSSQFIVRLNRGE